jgi:hypothetical protein
MRFVVDKVSVGQVFSDNFHFSCKILFHELPKNPFYPDIDCVFKLLIYTKIKSSTQEMEAVCVSELYSSPRLSGITIQEKTMWILSSRKFSHSLENKWHFLPHSCKPPSVSGIILWHDAQKPEQWSQNGRSLSGNDSLNTFQSQRIRKQQSSNFSYYATEL